MQILEEILKHNANVCVYDPKAMENAQRLLNTRVSYADSAEEACKGADLAVILTEWEEFKDLDLSKLKQTMKMPQILICGICWTDSPLRTKVLFIPVSERGEKWQKFWLSAVPGISAAMW